MGHFEIIVRDWESGEKSVFTDNSAMEPLQWIGPGKIFERELALDQFCKDHGFVGHFEIIN